jgi:hypothetical protein
MTPILWQTNDFNIFAVASPSLTTLTFVIDFTTGGPFFNGWGGWGLFNAVPITLDGNAYNYSLTTDPAHGGTLENWGQSTIVTANLAMSADSTTSGSATANLIAVQLTNIALNGTNENITVNGNGIYDLSTLEGDYTTIENSTFNLSRDMNLIENLINAIMSGFTTYTTSKNAYVAVGAGVISLFQQNWNFNNYTPAELEKFTAENFSLIVTQGWNAYFAKLKQTPPSSIGVFTPTGILIGAIAIAVIAILAGKKR